MMNNNSTNSNIGKKLLFATIAGSSLITSFNYDSQYLPSITANYSELKVGYQWENKDGLNINYSSEYYEYATIIAFAEKLISQSQDIDIEIQEAVNKIFWDLL